MVFNDTVLRPIARQVEQQIKKLDNRFYRYVTRRFAADDILFLNYGYEEDPPMAIPLDAADEPDRFPIQLYHRAATQADLSGKRVLEVSCGHGGGASYLTRTLHPASYIGLDLNPAGVAFCRQRHNLTGLEFVQGDAENLPFPDQSFDAVINIQSSVHYPHLPRFLVEVARVLNDQGHFLYADMFDRRHTAEWESALADAPMRMLSQREINPEVVRGMEGNSQRWQDVIRDRQRPTLLRRKSGCQFVRGSKVYHALQSGGFSFRMYCFAKA